MKEIWKDIKNFEGLYQISNYGNIYSNNRKMILKPRKDKDGYLGINLYKNNCSKSYRVHRLVAIHFIFNPDDKLQVNHIDGNKENNCVWNLEWCTQEENMQHSLKHKLRPSGQYCYNSKLTNEDVLFIRNNYKKSDKIFNRKYFAKKFNVHSSTISRIVNNKKWKQN